MTLFPNLLSYGNVPDEIQIWRKEISVKAVHQISRNMFYFYLLNLLSLIFRKLLTGRYFISSVLSLRPNGQYQLNRFRSNVPPYFNGFRYF